MQNYKKYQKLIKIFSSENSYKTNFEKKKKFLKTLNFLHTHHKENCDAYGSLSNEKRIIKKKKN